MISQFVKPLVSPLGTALIILILSYVTARLARSNLGQRVSQALLLSGLVWLYGWSTPALSEALRGWWEQPTVSNAADVADPPAVIVLLGGGLEGPRPPVRPYPNLTAAGDRIWEAARLYHQGGVQTIVASGGGSDDGDGPEAEAMQGMLTDFGVPAAAILRENRSITTFENARFTAALLLPRQVRRIRLLTSALHMPRARLLFERAGFQVVPAPCDIEVIPHTWVLTRILPDSNALDGSARVFKEILGYVLLRWINLGTA